jgi:hypothetical protein
LSLAGISFEAQAAPLVTVTVGLVLDEGVTIAASVFDLNGINPVRQFSTFG